MRLKEHSLLMSGYSPADLQCKDIEVEILSQGPVKIHWGLPPIPIDLAMRV